MSQIIIPQIVLDSYADLCALCDSHKDGRISAINTAEYLGMSYESFRNLIFAGKVPFAFGNNQNVGRGVSCIHVLPFYQYMTQGAMVNQLLQGGEQAWKRF